MANFNSICSEAISSFLTIHFQIKRNWQNFIFKRHVVSELCYAKVLIVFLLHLLVAEIECAFVYNFFAAAIFDNISDNLFFLKMLEKSF